MLTKNLVANPLLAVLLLAVLMCFCFAPIFGGYFLADDIWQVSYISQIAHGNWGLLWHNFTGNFLDIPSSSIYRPLIALSMVADFAIWKVNAAGWFGTNLVFYIGDVLLVYFLARALEFIFYRRNSAAPVVSAALFATYPLHCEPVCWLAGRSDLICSFFFLLALFIEVTRYQCKVATGAPAGAPQNGVPNIALNISGLIAFWLALLSKEMAVLLPFILFAFALIMPARTSIARSAPGAGKISEEGCDEGSAVSASDSTSNWQVLPRLREAFRLTWPYLFSDAIYFALRLKFLGTLGGGYTDVLGILMRQSMLQRILDWKTLYLLYFPFSENLYGGSLIEPFLLACCYAVLLIVGFRSYSGKLLAFLLIWAGACVLPVLQMWGLGPDLEASRIYFFASVPMCIAVGALVARSNQRWLAIPIVIMLALWYQASHALAIVWADTGKEVRAIAQQAASMAQNHSGKLIVLSLPKERHGALMITNGGMFLHLMSPPFHEPQVADRFIVFDRIFTEPDQFINATRFKAAIVDSGNSGPYLWFKDRFLAIDMGPDGAAASPRNIEPSQIVLDGQVGNAQLLIDQGKHQIDLKNIQRMNSLLIKGLDVNPLNFDFLEMEVGTETPKMGVAVAWDTIDQNAATGRGLASIALKEGNPGDFHLMRLRLSHQWRWYATARIARLLMQVSPCRHLAIRNMRLVSAERIVPKIYLDGALSPVGVYYLTRSPFALHLDGGKVPNATSFELQISRPNYMFDSFDHTDATPAVAKTMTIEGSVTTVRLPFEQFPDSGYYQIRCRALSADHKPVGEFSDSVTLFR